MATTDAIESTRLVLQHRLDSDKTQLERNKLGQFATPTVLALDILEFAKAMLPPDVAIRFLDPAFGTGSFYSALLQTFPLSSIVEATGYEIDTHYGRAARHLWGDTLLNLRQSDFTRATPPKDNASKVNLLVCNPPYVRHHHLAKAEKIRLQLLVERMTGIRLSGLTGLYGYFLCLSHAWLAENGLAGWLIPSEFMDVNYGQAIKNYLLNKVTLLRVHRFDPNDVQFDDALVSSTVVWFKQAAPPPDHIVELSYGGSLAEPKLLRLIPAQTLDHVNKWAKLAHLSDSSATNYQPATLSDLFKIQRGIATGANKFFILTPDQIAQHHLPAEFLMPILPSPRYLSTDEINADSKGNPLLEHEHHLLNCDLSEGIIKAKYPTLWKYLQTGIEAGIHEQYLCRHRSPWYSQENRLPTHFLCTYMGRKDVNGDNPFRFILNHSRAIAPNVYLMMYPKPVLQSYLKDQPQAIKAVWQALNSIAPHLLVREGRVYGGGLHKLEPNELANAPADEILVALPEFSFDQIEQQRLFEKRAKFQHS